MLVNVGINVNNVINVFHLPLLAVPEKPSRLLDLCGHRRACDVPVVCLLNVHERELQSVIIQCSASAQRAEGCIGDDAGAEQVRCQWETSISCLLCQKFL